MRYAVAYTGSEIDAALLALEVEIFDNDVPLTDNDEFLVRTFSHWSVEKRTCAFSGLMKNYGQPNLGSHVAHALAVIAHPSNDRP
jgi:hypothetical protein